MDQVEQLASDVVVRWLNLPIAEKREYESLMMWDLACLANNTVRAYYLQRVELLACNKVKDGNGEKHNNQDEMLSTLLLVLKRLKQRLPL